MSIVMTRRLFMKASTLAGAAGLLRRGIKADSGKASSEGVLPVVIASANGRRAVERAYRMIKEEGADTLDAVIAGVNINEDDPEDNSVGYGGLPNEDGVVELDASVMHGPSRRAGAVASLRGIRNPSKVAYLVMKRTDHVLLVGDGARRFAFAHGFKSEDLLTEKSRMAWLAWKESMSDRDGWGPGLAAPERERDVERKIQSLLTDMGRLDLERWVEDVVRYPPQGTINCLAVGGGGDISGVTTTSGLAWKISGRVGDSPLIGCGLFVDNDVGAAGSTGRGEEAIKINGAHTVVELMRRGASPMAATFDAVRRVALNYGNDRERLASFNIIFYAVNKNGEHGATSLWSGAWKPNCCQRLEYVVADNKGVRLAEALYLLEKQKA